MNSSFENRIQFGRVFVLVGFCILFALVYGFTAYGMLGRDSLEVWSVLLGIILILWASYNFIQSRLGKDFDIFSPYSFFALFFAMSYGVGLIYGVVEKGPLVMRFWDYRQYYPAAGLLSLLGYATFLVGHRINFVQRFGTQWKWPQWQASERGMILMFLIFQIGGWISRYINFRHGLYFQTGGGEQVSFLYVSFVGTFIPFTYSATVLALVKHFRCKQGINLEKWKFWRVVAYLSLLAEFLYGIPTGSKTHLFIPFILWLFAYNYSKRLVSLKKAVIIGVFFMTLSVLLFPLNMIYRDITGAKYSGGKVNSSDILNFWKEAIDEYQGMDPIERRERGEEITIMRSSYVSILARILGWHEGGEEYYVGETYVLGLIALIPRIIWPGKPEITLGQKFNWQLGFGFEHQQSSLAITMLGELFVNFGIPGILIGMLIFGFIYRQLYRIFSTGFNQPNGIAIPAYILFWYHGLFEGTACNFAGVFSGLCKTFLIFFLVAHLCGFRYRSNKHQITSLV